MALSSRASCPRPSFAPAGGLGARWQNIRTKASKGMVVCHAHSNGMSQLDLTSRRQLLLAAGVITVSSQLPSLAKADEEFTTYEDAIDRFKLNIPANWDFGTDSGTAGARRTLAWYPQGDARQTNLTVVVTPASGEYTTMGSLGSADTFASNLVNSMDRSYLLRAPEWARGKDPIQIAKLLDVKDMSGRYYLEYFVENPTEGKKHLFSVVSLGYNGRYNRLYTATAQCPEGEVEQRKAGLIALLKTFASPRGV